MEAPSMSSNVTIEVTSHKDKVSVIRQRVIVLEVDTTKLKIDDESIDTVKQGYLMLYEWFKNCDPETRTHATLRAALEEAECFAAMECLSLDAK
ncbi:Hypothetical predicted protein [Octopus vulgaris]|uniref:Uncharacterized protein n=1 Tax=Octopus vulgaris TaxID=6645 RepID=A0AA36HIM0_OCTVU|nr:Hypothetical predicted protein [Octopus vulgaris]